MAELSLDPTFSLEIFAHPGNQRPLVLLEMFAHPKNRLPSIPFDAFTLPKYHQPAILLGILVHSLHRGSTLARMQK